MSTNLPLGTYVTDGVRTGPFYSGQLPSGFVADNNGVIVSGSHSQYGPGILLSPQNTYTITPAAPAAGFTVLNNLVALTADGAVSAAGDLFLTGDNSVTFNNGNFVQFDWPRVVALHIQGAIATPGTRVTIFGTDWYGVPLQNTYIVSAIGNYPGFAAKAFYTVNRVHISAALPAGSRISLGASEVFGLPYAVDTQDIVAVSWDGTSELTVKVLGEELTTIGDFLAADTTFPATATTTDVRGVYSPASDAGPGVSLKFTAVIHGADQWQNQVANMQQLYTQNTGNPPQGIPIAPLTPADLYGVPQYYTGVPS